MSVRVITKWAKTESGWMMLEAWVGDHSTFCDHEPHPTPGYSVCHSIAKIQTMVKDGRLTRQKHVRPYYFDYPYWARHKAKRGKLVAYVGAPI